MRTPSTMFTLQLCDHQGRSQNAHQSENIDSFELDPFLNVIWFFPSGIKKTTT